VAVAEHPTALELPQLDLLWAALGALGPATDPVTEAYGGTPLFPSPHDGHPAVVANFVSTLDGVVSYATPEAAGGGEISGFFATDRFVMALLRSHADAVLIGAGTVRAAPDERWTAADVYPHAADAFAAIRRAHDLPAQPSTVVMTSSGDLDPAHPGLSDPEIPVVVAHAAETADRQFAPNVERLRVSGVADLLTTLHARGMRLVLCEGGPHLMAELLRERTVDELFLTVAPQIAGRSGDRRRLALVEGLAFDVADAPWWELRTIHRAGQHLFLRYAHNPTTRGD
jgi:riboflavin biosynthesis pyrimidine reductase